MDLLLLLTSPPDTWILRVTGTECVSSPAWMLPQNGFCRREVWGSPWFEWLQRILGACRDPALRGQSLESWLPQDEDEVNFLLYFPSVVSCLFSQLISRLCFSVWLLAEGGWAQGKTERARRLANSVSSGLGGVPMSVLQWWKCFIHVPCSIVIIGPKRLWNTPCSCDRRTRFFI